MSASRHVRGRALGYGQAPPPLRGGRLTGIGSQVIKTQYELARPTSTLDDTDGQNVVRHEPTWREEPESDDEYDNGTDHKTLYALFGLAIYKANVLEHSLVNALALTKLVTAREQGEQLTRDPWAQGFKDMMGRLIKRVEAHTSAYPEVGNDLTRSLKRRNDLVHNFWRERIQETITDASRAKLCADLKADCRLFTQTDERFSEWVLNPIMAKVGVTPEDVEAQYLKERREVMARYETEAFTAEENPT
ncbi:hypothetical protein OHB53_42710 [Streptomyces sp. NBC_00056]|uniref:hypothetical protein n=1 Tax=unclassified Streptomyces TaxID=2593676 RepID=UPI0032522AC3